MVLKVFVVGRSHLIESIFAERGWEIATSPSEPKSLMCFEGSSMIDPRRYQEKRKVYGTPDTIRDEEEFSLLESNAGIPKVGINRGALVLNINAGGSVWQNVDNHHGEHDITDLLSQDTLRVGSHHSAAMRPSSNGQVIAFADRATSFISEKNLPLPEYEAEVVWYEYEKSLCFQPLLRSEKAGDQGNSYFFDLLEYFYGYR